MTEDICPMTEHFAYTSLDVVQVPHVPRVCAVYKSIQAVMRGVLGITFSF